MVFAALIGGAILFLRREPGTQPEAPPQQPPAATIAEPEPHYPIPVPEPPQAEQAPAPPLPPLDESDAGVRNALEQTFGKPPVEALLIPTEIVRHVVATVDSLDRDPVPLDFRPVKYVGGLPVVDSTGGTLTLSADNARRYQPYISALQTAGTAQIADVYFRYYPILQKAYEDLGYPGRYFNDRMVRIIDHLLATPEVKGPITLVRPKVLYVFADPELEKRSWGQKALIRMGPENAATVKASLRELRAVIAAQPVKR